MRSAVLTRIRWNKIPELTWMAESTRMASDKIYGKTFLFANAMLWRTIWTCREKSVSIIAAQLDGTQDCKWNNALLSDVISSGCRTPPVSSLKKYMTASRNFHVEPGSKTYNDIALNFSPVISPQVHRWYGIWVINKFVKRSIIPRGEPGINSRANVFGASEELDALQDNRLKKNHPPFVPFTILCAVKLRCNYWDRLFPTRLDGTS